MIENCFSLADDVLEDAIYCFMNALELPLHTSKKAENTGEAREEVWDLEARAIDEALMDGCQKVICLATLHTKCRPGHDAVGYPVEL
jgi:hypothetical protein